MDKRRQAVGTLVGRENGAYLLRPLRGGAPWLCPVDDVRPASAAERLTAGLRAANEASTQGEPVDFALIGFGPRDPEPYPGCEGCARLVRARQAARCAGDFSKASDANVLLWRHLGQRHDGAAGSAG